jgi:hypothetical protein
VLGRELVNRVRHQEYLVAFLDVHLEDRAVKDCLLTVTR